MRLFVAITPPVLALDELDAAVAPLRPGPPGQLHWTSPESWHITLAFLGEVDELVAERLAPWLERAAAGHCGPALSTQGAGAFPSAPRAQVLWTGIQGDRAALRQIANSVAAGAREAGAPAADEGRRFRPHITLARLREQADVRPLIAQLKGHTGPTWQADRIHLIRSQLGPEPWYESVGSWPLHVSARSLPR